MELGCSLGRNEKEGAKTANRVDKPKVGRREVDSVHGFPMFPRFSSFGKVMSD